MSFIQLLKINIKLVYRNTSGLFWTLVMPATMYVALSVLPIGSFVGTGLHYSNYILPGMIALTIMQGGIYGLAYWMVDNKARGVIKRFMVTPIKKTELVISLLCARVVIMVVQVIVLTTIGVVLFKASFAGNIISVAIFTLLGGFIFLLLGLFISTFANSYDAAAPITTAVGLPLTFLGNVFYPVDGLPHALRVFAKCLPITYLADGFRKVYLYPFHFKDIYQDMLILVGFLIFMLAVTIWRFRLEE